MLKCNGKTFMNLQEAVQWLLNNNALFFVCNEDYAADTEISLSDLVNPSPANPKIGSLVLFSDGKISTINGLTDDSFTVGDTYVDMKFGREVTDFEIDASQHLIVNYADGTSQDLGAIFSGNITISGDLTVTGKINNEPNPSVKPIYCHAIYWSLSSPTYDENPAISLLIFNNSSTPFTVDTLAVWLQNLYLSIGSRVTILASGGKTIISTSVTGPMSRLTMLDAYHVYFTAKGVPSANWSISDLAAATTVFDDGVNKIN